MNPIRILPTTALAAAMAGLLLSSATAGVVFSESFEAPVVSGFAGNTVPSGGKWIGATDGFGATNRGLYNETVAWPATPAFSTPYGKQAYFINYTNSGLTTAAGATTQTLTADVTYKVTFHAAVTTGTASGNYRVELVAFSAGDIRTDANGTMPGTVLAAATGAVTTKDMSATGSVTFTPVVGNAHLGKDLAIRLVKSTNSVLYDNIRLITGHDLNPSPASGEDLANGGNVTLGWTNMPPTAPATNTYVDVFFGTNSGALAQVVDGALTSSTIISAPTAGTYYWRVDSYPDGNPNGTPVIGQVFSFTIGDTDGDGFPDTYELANTNPPSNTALNPGDDLDSDGLTNLQEYQYGTSPGNPDSDNDGLFDGPELVGVGTRPATSPVKADTDGDGLKDGVESNTGTWVSATNTGTNPIDKDWDNDGLSDGVETNTGNFVDRFNTGSNPFLVDTDNDGAWDWYESVATFTDPNSNTETSPIPYPLPDPVSTDLGATDKPVKVYIMAGQSNMVGIGYVNGTNPGTLETIAKRENKFPNLVDGTNTWTKRNDVIYKGVVTATAAGPLTAGQGGDSGNIGPELGFGQVMGWYHGEPVLLLKASQGNRSLGWDFLPPGSTSWTSGTTTYAGYGQSPQTWVTASGAPAPGGWYAGKQYDDCFLAESNMGMIPWATGTAYAGNVMVRHNGAVYISKSAHTADASSEPGIGTGWASFWTVYTITNAADVLNFTSGQLQNLSTTGNNLNGRSFEIAGFVWWQGHKDQDGGSIYSTRYETNLVKLINELRSDFNAPNAPFVVGSIGFGGEAAPKTTAFNLVYNAQMAVGNPTKHPQFAGTVKSVNTLPYWRELNEAPGAQGYHYNNSAETYMLIGDAMGRAMLEMQNDTSPPSPNTPTFAIAPTAVNTSTVGMVVTTAVDVSGPVQYYFENTSNSTNSGWITGTQWNNTGLSNGVSYDFRVKARDSKLNETNWSAVASVAPGNDVTKPLPDPMSFSALPTTQGENSISMTATTATDINVVQYYFDCTVGGGTDSGWQSSPEFTATGLNPGTLYTFVVRARDSAGNTTADSPAASATTTAPDTAPPTPATMSFATPPTAIGTNAISMTATTASDPSGVEYFFEETSGNPGGDDSSWQNSATYTDTGLQPGTEYTYRVRARDKSPAQTATNWSAGTSATTALPDTTPPSVSSLSPADEATNVAVAANLSVTFDEEITLGTGLITIKNLSDATQSTIDITDGSQISTSGAVLTINPTANLANSKNYAVQIAATAINDLEENSFPGILSDTTWNFTTVDPPPSGIVFADGFEPSVNPYGGTTPNVTSYTVANTSGQANATLWVRATSGFGSTRNGLIDESENGGANFTDPVGSQAYGFRYTNSGVTTAFGKVGTLTAGQTITVTFDVITDGYNAGTPYEAALVLFNGAGTRTAVENLVNNTAAILARTTGNASGTGYQQKQFSYTVGNSVYDNNGAGAGAATTWLNSLLGMDIALRFKGATSSANIDNVQVSIIGPDGPGPVTSFAISPIASPQTVGTPITGITLTAKDASNNTVTGFTGTVTFGGTGGFTGTSANFVAGMRSGVSVTPTVAGSNLTLTVSDGASPTPHTGSTTIATINPAASAYDTWAGTEPFNGDVNGDGVESGVAWLLGAATPNADASGLLPIVSQNSGSLVLTFRCLNAANRGGAVLNVQHSSNLGASDPWATAAVPETSGPVSGVSFSVTPDGNFNNVVATIPVGEASSGKLFGRLLASP